MRARPAVLLPLLLGGLAAPASATPLLGEGDASARSCASPAPPGWQLPGFDDTSWSRGPEPAACPLLRVRRRFEVADPSRLVSLTLTVRYQDGFVAWINGLEVARRRYQDGAPLALEPHGGESERVPLPLPAGLLVPGGNLIAVEVHPFRPGRAASVELGLDGGEGARLVRGPYFTRVGEAEAHLAFETDLPSRAEVRFRALGGEGPLAPLDRVVVDEVLSTRHLMRLEGLLPGRAYRYRVSATAPGLSPVVADDDFHTPPDARHPLRLVVTGDTRSGHEVHEQVVRAIAAEDPDLVLMTGDLVATGSDEAEWQRWFDIEAPLLRHVPVCSAIGNHEYWRNADGAPRFARLFEREGATWTSFDLSGVHVVLLDSEAYRDPAQLAWLRRDLAEALTRHPRALLAVTHHGPYSSGLHGDNADAKRDYVPLLEAAGVTLLLSGHDHDYERGQVGGLRYIVSGGGGAELRAPRCGVAGRRRCPPQVKAFFNEHHYLELEVRSHAVRVCPKRPDGTALEACFSVPSSPASPASLAGPANMTAPAVAGQQPSGAAGLQRATARSSWNVSR